MPKSKYETHVKPYLERIRGMCLDMTEEQIIEALGIGKSAWYRYKNEHEELREAVKKSRLELIAELKSTLIQRARGFSYTETKTILDGDGNIIKQEVYERFCPPDQAALSMLFKNYDENWHNDDAATLELKRKQVEIMKQKADDAAYD